MATPSISPAHKSKREICELIQASAPASFLATHKITGSAKNCVKRIPKARLIEIYNKWQQNLAVGKTILEIERPTEAVESRIVASPATAEEEPAVDSEVSIEAKRTIHDCVNSHIASTDQHGTGQCANKTKTKAKVKGVVAVATNVSVSRHAKFFLAEQEKQRPNPAMVAAARGQSRVASRLAKLQRSNINNTNGSRDGSATAVASVNAELGIAALRQGHVSNRTRVAEREIEAQKRVGNSAEKALEARREIESAKSAAPGPGGSGGEDQGAEAGEDAEAGPCTDYQLDLTGAEFGVCKCGFSKAEHGTKKLPSWAKKGAGSSKASARPICPPCP